MDRLICDAIKNKQIITFEYEFGVRIVEPYRLGLSTQQNKVLRAFQLRNSNKIYENQEWRLFSLSKIRKIQLSSNHFNGLRNDYGFEDKAMTRPYVCEVNRY